MRRAAALLLCAALVACGGRQEIYDVPPGELEGGGELTLPPPVPASPAFVLRSRRPLAPRVVRRVEKVPGVAVAAPVAVRRVAVAGPRRRARLTVGAVQPLQFRSVAPAGTRDADFVWLSLLSGRATVTFAAADRLRLEGAARLRMGGVGEVAVGAFADNGAPRNVADVLLASSAAPFSGPVRTVVIGAQTGTVLQRLGRQLARAVPRARVKKLTDAARAAPEPKARSRAPQPTPAGVATGGPVGTMTFEILKNGFIRPDPAWIRSNIAEGSVPILGTVTCHRIMLPQLRAALTEIEGRGLAGEIRPGDYGGCFVPRFIDRDPGKPLSMHAFGLAIDFNVSTNGLGTRGDIDPRVVEIFRKWGFEWGGAWSRPDPMHFELDRLLTG